MVQAAVNYSNGGHDFLTFQETEKIKRDENVSV